MYWSTKREQQTISKHSCSVLYDINSVEDDVSNLKNCVEMPEMMRVYFCVRATFMDVQNMKLVHQEKRLDQRSLVTPAKSCQKSA